MEFILNFAQALAVSVLLIGCPVTVCWVMHNYFQQGTSGRPLKVRINTHGGPCPKQYGEWIDLCTAENAVLSAGEYQMISLGISMEIPRGYYAEVVPRSSTYKRYGIILANSMGVIENAYCGDDDIWHFPAIAMRDAEIPAGTRICQFRLHRENPHVVFEQVEHLENEHRGGFGSTGV